MAWYWLVLSKYAQFDGRATRAEYWYFTLINMLVVVALGFVDSLIGFAFLDMPFGLLGGVYSLAILMPYWAVTVRRLHDTGRSGWWLLLELLPGIGHLLLFIFMVLDSHYNDNEYGANPKPGQQGGSSLLLVLVVILVLLPAIIGFIAAIALPAYQDYVSRTQQPAVQQGLSI